MAVKKTMSLKKPWPLLIGVFLMCQTLLAPNGNPYPLGRVDRGAAGRGRSGWGLLGEGGEVQGELWLEGKMKFK